MDVTARERERRAKAHDDPEAMAAHYASLLRSVTKVSGLRNVTPGPSCNYRLHVWEDRPTDARPWMNLRAYAGDEIARKVLGWCCCPVTPSGVHPWEFHDNGQTLQDWFRDLLYLSEDLPNVTVEVNCDHGGGHGNAGDCFDTGTRCAGKGTRTIETLVSCYLAMCVGTVVGQVALAEWKGCEGQGNMEADTAAALGCYACKAPRRALDACERWTWCPCPKNEEAVTDLAHDIELPRWAQPGLLLWPWNDATDMDVLHDRIESAETLIGPIAVREATRLTVLKMTRDG